MSTERMRRWYLNNRELALERARIYRQTHREQVNAYNREYYRKKRALLPPPPPKAPKEPKPRRDPKPKPVPPPCQESELIAIPLPPRLITWD